MAEHYGRRQVTHRETVRANRRWWDDEASGYYTEHGRFLGDSSFVWGPEGWTEEDLGILGPVEGLVGARVLEFGAGAAQCGRWLAARGAVVASTDLSTGMLEVGRALNAAAGECGRPVPSMAACDASTLPFADESFDLAVSSYGAVPFVADSAGLMAELARVVRPGGRVVFSTSHPVRWAFPDVPGEAGLTVTGSYFDIAAYVESEGDGTVRYAEHHRTLGARVREIVAAGLVLEDLVEPEWPERNEETWGGWSPLRGRLIPGTAIFVCARPR